MNLGNQSITVQEALVSLVSSFAVVLQELAVVMTVPSFQNFVTILTGWAFARRRTITGILTASGIAGKRHHSAFHRLCRKPAGRLRIMILWAIALSINARHWLQ
jgi:hypothetical protein